VLDANLPARLAHAPSLFGYLGQLYAASGFSRHQWIRRITQPTLVMAGDDDPLVPVSERPLPGMGDPRRKAPGDARCGSPDADRQSSAGEPFDTQVPAGGNCQPRSQVSGVKGIDTMLYRAYDARSMMMAPVFAAAGLQARMLRGLAPAGADLPYLRGWRAWTETVSALKLSHERPEFGIDAVTVDGREVAVQEEIVRSTAFASLVRFAKPAVDGQPKILVVPGLAGHFATLVRPTVRTLLSDHDVFVADWRNARDVPVSAGRFGLDEYVEHVIEFIAAIGPGTHVLAVCQPCPTVLAAAALMAEDDHPAQPESIILMAGPVDARRNPGPVNRFASKQSLESLERRVITTVPRPHRGAGRRVYPGFLQVLGFMGMDPRRHLSSLGGMMRDFARGDTDEAERTKAFYEEYFAVLDIAAEFYLETAGAVFIDCDLPQGRMQWRDRRVDPSTIRSALLTIEAERDDMCPPGQTQAAHALCTGIPAARKRHHLQPGVGHYGVFSGSRFDHEIYPQIRSFVADGGGH
jgi:poly(3-hydroxybutyrate) depolymerase